MSQYKNVRLYGFVRGKYTYWAKNMSFYRRLTENVNGKIIKLTIQNPSHSFGWFIGDDWINRKDMHTHCGTVYLRIKLDF